MQRKTFPNFGKIVLLSAALVTGGVALANAEQKSGEGKENQMEVQTFLASPQSLGQAITAAEGETGGKAMDASFDLAKDNSGVYEVELVKPDGTQVEVIVDAKGAVTVQAMVDDHDEGDNDND
ncbi:PepSY domain-containing protein [Roseovarius arcticus]|uniref:PepSY domain-containing protein n=1 Tax=Roseovarius arcticus TaxID=2547404 RepID=UPI0014873A99|nr:PepSY domain-containing protein [Roseovarius arcticus]